MKIQAEDFLVADYLKHGSNVNIAVAGGALRDALLNKEIKDVDLFVLPGQSGIVDLNKNHAELWLDVVGRNIHGVYTDAPFSPVKDLWVRFDLEKQGEGESECGEDFSSYLCPEIPGLNVVVLGSTVRTAHSVSNNDQLIKYLFYTFPCNMSKIALNSDGLHVHDSFWDGVRDKQFVYDTSKIRNNYIDRMMEKYPHPEWKHDSEYTISMSTTKGLGIKSVYGSLWRSAPTGSITPPKSFPY